ncbi:hypothetical protein PAT3040_01668 [Paenibacillus agaridevorans]|uniref:Uncharacterized protein n=1 Tax=Paenibacillus agaridevorans TaxID=171404 RepID=A0A2R5EKF9_9BACL|nr:hypothetical protein PAT3040_01668 [Paenibacillus agaridevorans]
MGDNKYVISSKLFHLGSKQPAAAKIVSVAGCTDIYIYRIDREYAAWCTSIKG